jgi:Ran-binding protein 9/10
MPRREFDIYAAIGVCGRNLLQVNFGAAPFRWKEGNEWAWRVEGHVAQLEGPSGMKGGDELPTYSEARGM